MRSIMKWLGDHGSRSAAYAVALHEYLDVLDGAGQHANHMQTQDGPYVRCSCGEIAKGRLLEQEQEK